MPAHYVVLTAYHVYFLSDGAGAAGTDLDRWSIPRMARGCRISVRYMADALTVCHALRIVKRVRDNRRRGYRYLMNAGGMTFATLRTRVQRAASTSRVDALSTSRVDAPKGYVQKGHVQEHLFAAAPRTPSREASPAVERQQQQPGKGIATENERRIEGLIGAIAARSRTLGENWNEANARRRIADREITVEELQTQADQLEARRCANHGGGHIRQPHQIIATLAAGGRCTVCGIRRPDPAGFCPGPRA